MTTKNVSNVSIPISINSLSSRNNPISITINETVRNINDKYHYNYICAGWKVFKNYIFVNINLCIPITHTKNTEKRILILIEILATDTDLFIPYNGTSFVETPLCLKLLTKLKNYVSRLYIKNRFQHARS